MLVSLGSAPPIPPIPPEWHGRKVATVVSAYAGAASDGQSAVAPVRILGTPVTDLLGPVPYLILQTLVDPGWRPGARNYFTSTYLPELSDEAIEVIVAAHASAPSPFSEIHVHQMGGAVARLGADDSAFGNREAPFLLNVVARWTEASDDEANLAWARSLRDALAPFSTGHAYVNFLGVGDDRTRASYDGDRFERLAQLKRTWDPGNAFHLNQNIPPA
jgi:hypothetical protein